ncbi:xanthine dehydrogenase [Litorivita pollutaquae]|uniref:Xanthine dehydrogenase n=1 Tax=Litorivita pollutaquae TaxID=2200892 RepID=A0A2V4MRC3_9RHOB|nr:xanthine dehydrogenase family protein molybdopterin-binding subunit [Litorivita pollutaquae]PYC48099.1 xanthine dehydrogenase [Litorivita pollutaquae]
MEKFGKSQPVKRREDLRLVTGHGRYVDDIAPQGALFAMFLRSSVAHAVLKSVDVSAARDMPGVHLVVTSGDLLAAGITRGLDGATMPNRDGTMGTAPKRPILAEGKLRFVGEAIAMVIAETRAQAMDAIEAIEVEYDDLPAVLALVPSDVPIHDEAPDNRAYDWEIGDAAATEAAMAHAAHVVRMEVDDNRVIVNAIEPRGAYAEYADGRLHLAVNGQGVWGVKAYLGKVLNMPAENIRVTTPDVGGGFGMKGMSYPEYIALSHAAMVLGRPVRWMSERTEAMLSDNAGRDLTHTVEMGFDENHRITGYRVNTRCNLGAYNSQFGQAIQSHLFARVVMGTYDCQTLYMNTQGFYTNTTQVDAYRGAGRPEAIYLLERVMDMAARELGVDPFDLRRINFIKEGDFPYTSVTGETYDVGAFARLLDRAEAKADVKGFAARRRAAENRGNLRGLGICYYIESIMGDPSETAKVEFNEDGTVSIYVGTQSGGQGHETVYAQFLSDQTGIPADLIGVVQGDSDRIKTGGGTGGSRSVTTQSTATLATVGTMVEAFRPYLADKMGVEAAQITFDAETFRAAGSNMTPTLLEAAEMARDDGRMDLLVHEETTTLPGRSYPNGAHICEVEVDGETGDVAVKSYTVADDFGNLINPMLAEGQVHGGVAQGIGQALMEHVGYDGDGQLLTATFMDYAMPRADDVPMYGFETLPVPSTANPMGMKGCGEAGTVGSMAATANAVLDALWVRGVRRADMPFTPVRVWKMMEDAVATAQ